MSSELQAEIVREHYRDTCDLYRRLAPTTDADGLKSGGLYALRESGIRFQWANTQSVTDPVAGLGLVPHLSVEATDRGLFLDGTDIQDRDLLVITTPGHSKAGAQYVVIGDPQPFTAFFKQKMIYMKPTQHQVVNEI